MKLYDSDEVSARICKARLLTSDHDGLIQVNRGLHVPRYGMRAMHRLRSCRPALDSETTVGGSEHEGYADLFGLSSAHEAC